MARKHKQKAVTADDVSLAACKAMLRSMRGRRREEFARRALILARFAVAMKS